jgi:hypothetical protein
VGIHPKHVEQSYSGTTLIAANFTKPLISLCAWELACTVLSGLALGHSAEAQKTTRRTTLYSTRTAFRAACFAAFTLCSGTASALVVDVYSTSFENFALGPMSNGVTTQNGWSGGAQPAFTNNNNASVNTNGSIGDEAITNAAAHTGSQSWRYTRGYNSPGSGTPFSPNLSFGLGDPGIDKFTGSVWFRAVQANDNSGFAINTGTRAGDDRAEIVIYVSNEAAGIRVHTFGDNFGQVNLATGLSPLDWHELTFELTKPGANTSMMVALDGGPFTLVDPTGLSDFRTDNSFLYADSSRLKFNTRLGSQGPPVPNDGLSLGFYVDDITYSVSNNFSAVVPEPGSLALLSAALGAFGLSRRRKAPRAA